jgi:hypothetical protein
MKHLIITTATALSISQNGIFSKME